MFDLMKYKNLLLGLSVVLVVASIVSIYMFGFNLGVDLKGGTLWQLSFENQITVDEVKGFLTDDIGLENVGVTKDSSGLIILIRSSEFTEDQHQSYLSSMKEKFGLVEDLRFESIGPAIGKELRDKALLAFIFVLTGISLYVAFAFRHVSYPVSSWKYGIITLVTLFHDALISAGFFAFWGFKTGIEIDTNFIVAILVIIGFSVHDTIVVFDRIRENLMTSKDRGNLAKIVNMSVNQTFARSFNTSLTLVLVLITLIIFGASSLSYFTLLILLGTIIGTYSSIFVASPLLTLVQGK